MAALGAQTVASSYEQLLHTDTDGGGNGNTLVTIKDGDNGTTFGLKLATNKVEVIPGSDDANAFEVSQADGTAVFTVNTSSPAFTLTGTATITTADNTDTLALISTDADANAGPNLNLYRNSGSPADNDFLGNIKFNGRNDNSQDVQYAEIEVYATDVSDGTEDGLFNLNLITGGTNRTYMQLQSDEVVFNEDSADIDFRVESDGNANMFVVDAGNNMVGIGVNPTNALLEVKTDDENVVRFDGLQGNIDFRYGSDIEFDRAGIVYITANNGSGELQLRTGGQNTRLHIDEAGLVGIGTASPLEMLDVSKTNDGGLGPVLQLTNDPGSSTAVGTSCKIKFAPHHSGTEVAGIEAIATTTGAATALSFRTHTGGALGERMRIDSDGRVGIQTSSPNVGSFSAERGVLTISSTDNAGANNYSILELQGHSINNSGANGIIAFYDHTTENARIQSNRTDSASYGDLRFSTKGGGSLREHVRIRAAGNVWFQAGDEFRTATHGSVDRIGMVDMRDEGGYNPVLHVMSDRDDPDFSPLRLTGGDDSPSSASQCIWIDFHDGDGTHRGGIQNGSTADNPEFFNGGSDERIKTNIVDTATNGLQIINGLELKDFTVKEWYNGYSSDVTCDFIAQNAEEHFPDMVSEHKMKPKKEEFRQDFVDAGLEAVEVETALGTEEMFPVKCIAHAALIPILVKALQEADNKIDALTSRIEALENA